MKNFFLCVAILLVAIPSQAQEDTLGKSLTIRLPTPIISKTIVLKEVEIPIVSLDSVTKSQIDIKADHWDTTVYNPYKDVTVKYPLDIKFEDSTYAPPVSHKKVVTSRYGWRRGRPHKGIDIDLVTGDSVVTMFSGIVRFARYSRGHGRTVVVRHYNGLETTYAHLSRIGVKANDTLVKGQYLGKGGNTGNSRGSHLHLVVSYKGENIHPDYLFNFDETNTIRANQLWVTRKWTRPTYHSSKGLARLSLYKTKDEALASFTKTPKVYVVRKGDTLSRISQRNSTSIAAICRTNKIKRTSTLRIGQKLILDL